MKVLETTMATAGLAEGKVVCQVVVGEKRTLLAPTYSLLLISDWYLLFTTHFRISQIISDECLIEFMFFCFFSFVLTYQSHLSASL